jgi:DNA polymerase-1
MQGTAADIIKRAMIAVDRWLDDSQIDARMTMQVHDELVFEVADGDIDTLTGALPGLMADVAELDVPLLVETGTGADWEAAH